MLLLSEFIKRDSTISYILISLKKLFFKYFDKISIKFIDKLIKKFYILLSNKF